MPTKLLISFAILAASFFFGQHYERMQNDNKIAAANAVARQVERHNAKEVVVADKKLKEENAKDKDLYIAVRTGAQRLRLPASVPATPESGADAGAVPAQGCELDPKTAADLVSIAQEGDAAIRQLNELIDLYAK